MGHGVLCGRLAQLVEHLVYTERVGGSSPSAPTTEIRHFRRVEDDRASGSAGSMNKANNPVKIAREPERRRR
jgi:hypothetical protein